MTINDLRRAELAATKGPWAWQKFGTKWCLTGQYGMRPIVLATRKGGPTSLVDGLLKPLDPAHPDAAFIALSREAVPKLLAFIEQWDAYAACPDNVNFQGVVEARKNLEEA